MDLSIVIVNWNSKDYLLGAIAAVRASVRALHYEIVVIDSASYDGCGEALRKLEPGVVFLQGARNGGFAWANNMAFEHAQGRTVLFLNPDTEVRGQAIEAMYAALQRLPQAGIVGPTLLNSDGSLQSTCVRAFPTLLNQVLDSALLHRFFPNAALWGRNGLQAKDGRPLEVQAVSGACLMMRRDAFEAAGGFGTEYFMYSEDMELCLKARRGGWKTYYVPDAVVVHHGGASSGQAEVSTFAAVMLLESRWRFFRKTRSVAYAAAYRAAMAGVSLSRLAALLPVGLVGWSAASRSRARGGLRKWAARLRWTLGGERWVREY